MQTEPIIKITNEKKDKALVFKPMTVRCNVVQSYKAAKFSHLNVKMIIINRKCGCSSAGQGQGGEVCCLANLKSLP